MTSLAGLRVMIVEDEYLLARQLARSLGREGAEVVACVASVPAALAAVADGAVIDVAILDVNLGGEKVYPVATELARRGIRFVFLSGYDLKDRDQGFAAVPHLSKPVTIVTLARTLKAAAA